MCAVVVVNCGRTVFGHVVDAFYLIVKHPKDFTRDLGASATKQLHQAVATLNTGLYAVGLFFCCSVPPLYANTLDLWTCPADPTSAQLILVICKRVQLQRGLGTFLKVRRLPHALAVRAPHRRLLFPRCWMLAGFALKCAMTVLISILNSPWTSRHGAFDSAASMAHRHYPRSRCRQVPYVVRVCLASCSPRPVEVGTPLSTWRGFSSNWGLFSWCPDKESCSCTGAIQ